MTEQPPQVFIVDDDQSFRGFLVRLVGTIGLNAVPFASAEEFLKAGPVKGPACLVLDVQMDGMTGFDLQRRLAVPVIFITAHDDALTLERIRTSRVAGHLRKPIDAQAVLNAIRTAVDGKDQGPIGKAG